MQGFEYVSQPETRLQRSARDKVAMFGKHHANQRQGCNKNVLQPTRDKACNVWKAPSNRRQGCNVWKALAKPETRLQRLECASQPETRLQCLESISQTRDKVAMIRMCQPTRDKVAMFGRHLQGCNDEKAPGDNNKVAMFAGSLLLVRDTGYTVASC